MRLKINVFNIWLLTDRLYKKESVVIRQSGVICRSCFLVDCLHSSEMMYRRQTNMSSYCGGNAMKSTFDQFYFIKFNSFFILLTINKLVVFLPALARRLAKNFFKKIPFKKKNKRNDFIEFFFR